MKTKEKIKNKTFDTVKMMRDIRDRMSIDIINMSYAELKAYLKRKKKLKPEQV